MLRLLSSAFVMAFTIYGCQSDDTMDRGEVKLKAIYQEYNVSYSAVTDKVRTTVYFKTSEEGSYVKLSSKDYIQFHVEDSLTANFVELSERRKQVHWGSKNVPYYVGRTTLENFKQNEVQWRWYDHEEDKKIVTAIKLDYPAIESVSHETGDVIDTLKDESITINFAKNLTLSSNEYLAIEFVNELDSKKKGFSVRLNNQLINQNKATISAKDLRMAARNSITVVEENNSRQYGNLRVNSTSVTNIPILDSGRNTYKMNVIFSESKKVKNNTKKGGMIHKNVTVESQVIDIIF